VVPAGSARGGCSVLLDWTQKMHAAGFGDYLPYGAMRICSLHYCCFGACTEDLIGLYERHGFIVRSIPWEDPAYRVARAVLLRRSGLEVREKSLRAFDDLPKPVLLHCSSGIQRSSPVSGFIYSKGRTELTTPNHLFFRSRRWWLAKTMSSASSPDQWRPYFSDDSPASCPRVG